MTSPLAELIKDRRVLVCVGAGGVGKTTISATIGVAAARAGRRTLVLTVDPARRLANALGLGAFDEQVQTVGVEHFAADRPDLARPLDVAMLDVKSTFDRVVRRYATSDAHYQAIVGNDFYHQASTALAGSQEYMAMERLYEIATSASYDLIVLDTPPSAHALDFLDAPKRLIALLESPTFRLLLRSFRRSHDEGGGLFRKGSLLMRGIDRFTGAEMFHGLLDFFATLSATFDGFVERARNVLTLMNSERTAFVIVSACDETSIHEGLFLHKRLREEQMPVGAWVLNRVRPYSTLPLDAGDQLTAELTAALAKTAAGRHANGTVESTAAQLASASVDLAHLSLEDHRLQQRLERALEGELPVIAVPRSRDEPATLHELCRLAGSLVPPDPP